VADIYLSYKREDRTLAEPFSRALSEMGYSVDFDIDLASGARFDQEIERRVRDAKCIVVLWTAHSVTSDWVMSEAHYGKSANKLIPVRLDDTRLPLGFSQIQTVDLKGWRGDTRDSEFVQFINAVKRVVGAATKSDDMPTASERPPAPGERLKTDRNQPYCRPLRTLGKSIFIAHTTGDKPRIAPIVSILVHSGYSIWIDKPHLLKLDAKTTKKLRGIEYIGGDWKEQIRKGVDRATAVLALWSNDAIDARREQFYYEIYIGLVQGKLCQARLDPLAPSKIGMPFTFDQIADFSDFRADSYHPELDAVIVGLAKFRPKSF
jgi:TIR domain